MTSFADMLKEEEAAQQANGHANGNNTNATTNGRKRARVSIRDINNRFNNTVRLIELYSLKQRRIRIHERNRRAAVARKKKNI